MGRPSSREVLPRGASPAYAETDSQITEIIHNDVPIDSWIADKGYGFVFIGGQRVFLHASAIFPTQPRGTDLTGKCLSNVKVESSEKGFRVLSAAIMGENGKSVVMVSQNSGDTKALFIDGQPVQLHLPQVFGVYNVWVWVREQLGQTSRWVDAGKRGYRDQGTARFSATYQGEFQDEAPVMLVINAGVQLQAAIENKDRTGIEVALRVMVDEGALDSGDAQTEINKIVYDWPGELGDKRAQQLAEVIDSNFLGQLVAVIRVDPDIRSVFVDHDKIFVSPRENSGFKNWQYTYTVHQFCPLWNGRYNFKDGANTVAAQIFEDMKSS